MNDCKKGEIPQGLSPKKDSENIDFCAFYTLPVLLYFFYECTIIQKAILYYGL